MFFKIEYCVRNTEGLSSLPLAHTAAVSLLLICCGSSILSISVRNVPARSAWDTASSTLKLSGLDYYFCKFWVSLYDRVIIIRWHMIVQQLTCNIGYPATWLAIFLTMYCECKMWVGEERRKRRRNTRKKKDGFLGKFPEQVMLVAMQQIRISRVKVTKVRGWEPPCETRIQCQRISTISGRMRNVESHLKCFYFVERVPDDIPLGKCWNKNC